MQYEITTGTLPQFQPMVYALGHVKKSLGVVLTSLNPTFPCHKQDINRKSLRQKLLATIITCISFWSLLPNIAHSRPVLSLNDIKWPPYFLPKLEKNQIGFGKELLNQCISRLNYDIQYKVLPIKRTHLYMQAGELDISVYSYKKERESFVHYGKEPLFISKYGFASKKSDNLVLENIEDVKKYTFGHLAGLSHTPELTDILRLKEQRDEVIVGHNIDAMFSQLLATPQRFQIMANSKETLAWRAKQLEVADFIKVHEFTLREKTYFVTVSKNTKNIADPAKFLAAMDTCIKSIKTSGAYNALAAQYGLVDYEPPKL